MRVGRIGLCLALAIGGVACRRGPSHFEASEVPLPDLLALVPPPIRYEPTLLPDSQNRWSALLQAVANHPAMASDERAALERLTSDARQLTDAATLAHVRNYLLQYEPTFAAVREALRRPNCSIGSVKGGDNPMRTLSPVRHLVSVSSKKGAYLLAKGDVDEAVDALCLANEIVLSLNSAEAPLNYAVMSGSLLARVNREIRDAAWSPRMTIEGIDRLLAQLPSGDRLEKEFLVSLRSDLYWFIKNEVTRLSGPGGSSQSGREEPEQARDYDSGWQQADELAYAMLEGHENPFDRKSTVLSAQELYKEMIENVGRPWNEQTEIAVPLGDLVAEWPKLRLAGASGEHPEVKAESERARQALLKSANPYGRFALWYFIQVSQQSVLIPFRNRSDLEATRLSLMIRKHELESGRLPDRLHALVEKGWISEVPRDPFDGQPFRYDAARRRIWSVGQNGHDDEGREAHSLSARALDYVYLLNPSPTLELPDEAAIRAALAAKPAEAAPVRKPPQAKIELLKGGAR